MDVKEPFLYCRCLECDPSESAVC